MARGAGAPVGSIYHRYASRDEILAAVWLELVEDFQTRFLAALEGDDPVAAGLAAVRFTCRWVRRHPRDARLMLLHRREDFAAERWPASYRRRGAALAAQAVDRLRAYAVRLRRRQTVAEVRLVRFILVDLPTAALKRDVELGVAPARHVETLLLATCSDALRRAHRRGARVR